MIRKIVGLVVACAASYAGVAWAGEWDAKSAPVHASELEKPLDRALEVAETAPRQDTALQQRTRDAAVVEMRHVYEAARGLVTKLRIGAGRGETEALLSQVRSMFDHARKTAREAVPQASVVPLLEEAEERILELQKLYAQD